MGELRGFFFFTFCIMGIWLVDLRGHFFYCCLESLSLMLYLCTGESMAQTRKQVRQSTEVTGYIATKEDPGNLGFSRSGRSRALKSSALYCIDVNRYQKLPHSHGR